MQATKYKQPDSLTRLFLGYAKNRRAKAVSIRGLAECRSRDRATHLLHPYPAKLLPLIPRLFFGRDEFEQGAVLDPFCGSGTVLVEAMLAGRKAFGFDTNPLAVLLARVKTTPIEPPRIVSALQRLQKRVPKAASIREPERVNVHFWHPPRVIRQLLRLKQAIMQTRDAAVRDFFWACFSVVVRKGSYADPRISVPVRLNLARYNESHWYTVAAQAHYARLSVFDARAEFASVVARNAERMRGFKGRGAAACTVALGDARFAQLGRNRRVALIVTSPPYLGAQKYIRSSSFALAWLDLAPDKTLREIEDQNIGREHFPLADVHREMITNDAHATSLLRKVHATNPLRAHLAAAYLLEMEAAMKNVVGLLSDEGRIILVTGDNTIAGHHFPTTRYIREMCERAGCRAELHLIDEIRSRGLLTKRHHTSGTIQREHILVLKRAT